ncbi:MAG: glycosyltransferase [Motilibacteraceae bacterium]
MADPAPARRSGPRALPGRRLAGELVRRMPPPVQLGVRDLRRRWRRGAAGVRAAVLPGSRIVPAEQLLAPWPDARVRLLVGPANFAGQAWAWGRAAERHLDQVSARVVAVERSLPFPADLRVPPTVHRSQAWAAVLQRHVTVGPTGSAGGGATHALVDAFRPLFGVRNGDDCAGDLRVLRRHGVSTALAAHGSDVRLPSRHVELYPWSPFPRMPADLVGRLQAQAERHLRIAAAHEGPVYVSTPDQLDFVPRATWLPTVVDPGRWATDRPVLERERPVVLHAPSNALLKGSEHVEPVLQRLQAEGLVEYVRVEGVAPEEMTALVQAADIVVEQLVLGLYSLAAIEAMAAGRVVLAHVHPRVRERLPRELPVVEADPATLEQVLRAVLADRERYREVAAAGVTYATDVHDGRRSAAVLAPWLGARPRPEPAA